MATGKSVRMFLVDGTPGGLVTAEIMNWTGQVLAGARSELSALLRREEVRRTGVYVLIGDDPSSSGGTKIYVGEGDDVSTRLKSHEVKKDFWDRVVVLTSKDANLTKAHVRFLESKLISLALAAKRSAVDNGTAPAPPPLPEADVSDMDYFLSQVQIVLPVLGVDAFRVPVTTVAATAGAAGSNSSPVLVTGLKGQILARAVEVDGEFTVKAKSIAKPWKGVDTSYKALQDQLVTNGTLAQDGRGDLVFTHDQPFKSASAASAVVLGRSSNGRLDWRVEANNLTYADWQASTLPNATPTAGSTSSPASGSSTT